MKKYNKSRMLSPEIEQYSIFQHELLFNFSVIGDGCKRKRTPATQYRLSVKIQLITEKALNQWKYSLWNNKPYFVLVKLLYCNWYPCLSPFDSRRKFMYKTKNVLCDVRYLLLKLIHHLVLKTFVVSIAFLWSNTLSLINLGQTTYYSTSKAIPRQ